MVVIAGNHDQPERVASVTPLVATRGITLIGTPIADAVTVATARTGETAKIAALPYPSEARLNEPLSIDGDEDQLRRAYSERVGQLMRKMARDFSPQTVNLAMSHIYVLGGVESDSERPIQVGGAYTVDPLALSVGASYGPWPPASFSGSKREGSSATAVHRWPIASRKRDRPNR